MNDTYMDLDERLEDMERQQIYSVVMRMRWHILKRLGQFNRKSGMDS